MQELNVNHYVMKPQRVIHVPLKQAKNMNVVWKLLEDNGCDYDRDMMGIVQHKMEKDKHDDWHLLLFPDLKDSKFLKSCDVPTYLDI